MTYSNSHCNRDPRHTRVVTRSFVWLLLGLVLAAGSAHAQTPVVLSPVPKLQFFDASGRPLAFGCVFTYQSLTTTPLATYTDRTGTVVNSNPVVLDAGGYANGVTSGGMIWLAAGQAYTIKIKSAGGTNCASGSTLYTMDGIGGGLTLLTSIVVCNGTCPFPIAAQIQLFKVSLTGNAVANPLTGVGIIPPAIVIFEITQDASGAHTFTWPANSVGGAPVGSGANQVSEQMFVWNGSTAEAIGPAVIGTGPELSAGILRLTGQLISSLATGTAPFVIASSTRVANLNVSQLEDKTWEIPGTIGSTTPNTGVFSTLEAQTSLKVNGSQPQTSVQGGATDVKLLSSSTVAAGAGNPLCTDAAGGATTTCTGSGPMFPPQRVILGGNVVLVANTQTIILTQLVTFPSVPGNYRADVRYGAWVTAANNACAAEAIDTTNNRAFALSGLDGNGGGFAALNGAEISSATYAAGATATFTLQVQCNAAQTVTILSGLFVFAPNQSSYLSVTPVLSN
jgi:hypothetical protein